MNPKDALQALSSLFTEEEDKALEQATREIAAERLAWAALPQAERDRILAENGAKLEAMFAAGEADGPHPGEHRADAFRYGMELNRRYDALRAPKAADAGMRDTIAKLFPLPDYREPPALVPTAYFGQPPSRPVLEALATGYGLKASDMLTGAQPTLIDDLLAKASSRAAALVAQHTDAQIRAGLIKLGWTPPPGTTNTTKGE